MIVKRFHDETLGDVELRTNGWVCFDMVVNGRKVTSGIGIITDPDADYRAGLDSAKRLATICKSSDERFRRIVTNKLLDSYNRDWADGDELTADQFTENLCLQSVQIDLQDDESCTLSLRYDANEMYGIRCVILHLDAGLRELAVSFE